MSQDVVTVIAGDAGSREDPCELIYNDSKTRQLVDLARRVAKTDATVMITGESGTGKEVFARFIHAHSRRCADPFIAVNCAAIPGNMLEALLFGYEKGAFTGAYQKHLGKFEQAQGGTLLLDEITEMDLGLQAKLLRALQEREIERLGSRKTLALDVRVLATSNRDLARDVTSGRFRKDLYYRLNVFPLTLPPLAQRPGDIPPLAEFQILRHSRLGNRLRTLTTAAQKKLLQHTWPGNVRELDNVIQRALILAHSGRINADDIRIEPDVNPPQHVTPEITTPAADTGGLGTDLKLRERDLIIEALRVENGNRQAAARRLGISPRTLRYKLARLREMGLGMPLQWGLENV